MNLSTAVKTVVVSAATAAGTTTVTSSVVDLQGFDGVMYIAILGDSTINAVGTLTSKLNTINGTTGSPVSGASATYTDADGTSNDNKMLIVDEYRPKSGRYGFCTLARATANIAVNAIVAVLYQADKKPTAADATLIASGIAAGT